MRKGGLKLEQGKLYLVATPIGNLGDITRRAVDILTQTDIVAAEDTRHTAKLLNSLGLKKTMISFHEHSKKDKYEKLFAFLAEGKDIALVSDAGTPLISDPGSELVARALEAGITVIPVPGACSPICALIVSGLPTDRFVFEGFLPREGSARKKALQALKEEERTCIILESPFRVKETISDFIKWFGGERKAVICRELTKIYEETLRGTLTELAEILDGKDVKGEIVLVLQGSKKVQTEISEDEIVSILVGYLKNGLTKKDAVIKTALSLNTNKNKVYKILTKLKQNDLV